MRVLCGSGSGGRARSGTPRRLREAASNSSSRALVEGSGSSVAGGLLRSAGTSAPTLIAFPHPARQALCAEFQRWAGTLRIALLRRAPVVVAPPRAPERTAERASRGRHASNDLSSFLTNSQTRGMHTPSISRVRLTCGKRLWQNRSSTTGSGPGVACDLLAGAWSLGLGNS